MIPKVGGWMEGSFQCLPLSAIGFRGWLQWLDQHMNNMAVERDERQVQQAVQDSRILSEFVMSDGRNHMGY